MANEDFSSQPVVLRLITSLEVKADSSEDDFHGQVLCTNFETAERVRAIIEQQSHSMDPVSHKVSPSTPSLLKAEFTRGLLGEHFLVTEDRSLAEYLKGTPAEVHLYDTKSESAPYSTLRDLVRDRLSLD